MNSARHRTAHMTDARIRALTLSFEALADPEHAVFHKAYHKSAMTFLGLRVPDLRRLVKEHIPMRPKLGRAEAFDLAAQLWDLKTHEHRQAALILLARVAKDLTLADLPTIKRMTRDVDGWALLDTLAVHVLGTGAVHHGDAMLDKVRPWSKHSYLWTRRTSVLIHLGWTRAKLELRPQAWSTFDELLEERSFFIRKAIGWTLREACKLEPEKVRDFLIAHANRVSGLTRREGSRNLPEPMRLQVLDHC